MLYYNLETIFFINKDIIILFSHVDFLYAATKFVFNSIYRFIISHFIDFER